MEFVIQLIKRHLVVFLAENADFCDDVLEPTIQGVYGGLRLSREECLQKTRDNTITAAESHDYKIPSPFSYVSYLEYLLKDAT